MAPDPHETATLDAFDEITRRELSREAVTMALYVSITLLAALVAIPSDDVPGTLHTAALIWGGAAGLALAHWLAFDVGARLFRDGPPRPPAPPRGPRLARRGAGRGPVTSIPILIAPDDIASEVAISVLAFILAAAGFAVGRRSGAGLLRAWPAASSCSPWPASWWRSRSRSTTDRPRAGPRARATIRLRWAPTRRAPRKRSTATGTRTARRSSRARPATGRSARHA